MGIEEEAVSREITYFVFFIFVVYANHKNIFATKFADLRYFITQ